MGRGLRGDLGLGHQEIPGGRGLVFALDAWKPYDASSVVNPGHYSAMQRALKSGGVFRLFAHNIRSLGHEDVVRVLRGHTDELLPLLRTERFHIVFVDGDHRHDQVRRDLESAAPLVVEGGVLCGDDLELQSGEVDLDYAQAHADYDFVQDPKSGRWYHPGVTLAVGARFGPGKPRSFRS